jgi:hypothetical protein
MATANDQIDPAIPRIIICEGNADIAFFKRLLSRYDIKGFQIPSIPTESGGRPGFLRRLQAIKATPAYISKNIETVLLVSDNDDNPARWFNEVKSQIRDAEGYGIPDAPFLVGRSNNYPSSVVLMLPRLAEPGSLESLILEALSDSYPDIRQCLNEYVNCCPNKAWKPGKKEKMMVQCMTANICDNDPNVPLAHFWSKGDFDSLLDHSCFRHITDFLRELSR